MPRIRHTSNAERTRVRLISTPTGSDTTMTVTIAGVKFSDTLGALLDHAQASGFRIEPDNRGKRASTGVLVYPPSKEHPPFAVAEKGARHNPAHTDNIRRQLLRAGMPPMPGDRKTGSVMLEGSLEEVAAQIPEGMTGVSLSGVLPDGVGLKELDEVLSDPDLSRGLLGVVVENLSKRAGLGNAEADLISNVTMGIMGWALQYSPDRIAAANAAVTDRMVEAARAETGEALRLAEEAEKRAVAADKAAERAIAAEKKARDDCGAALERARAAEAEAARLEAAIAPLRALLGGEVKA